VAIVSGGLTSLGLFFLEKTSGWLNSRSVGSFFVCFHHGTQTIFKKRFALTLKTVRHDLSFRLAVMPATGKQDLVNQRVGRADPSEGPHKSEDAHRAMEIGM
jgi:hypothetical protein